MQSWGKSFVNIESGGDIQVALLGRMISISTAFHPRVLGTSESFQQIILGLAEAADWSTKKVFKTVKWRD